MYPSIHPSSKMPGPLLFSWDTEVFQVQLRDRACLGSPPGWTETSQLPSKRRSSSRSDLSFSPIDRSPAELDCILTCII